VGFSKILIYFPININRGDFTGMQDGRDLQVKIAIISEIEALQQHYATLRDYVMGKQYDTIEIMATLQVFRDGLNRLSAHILTLYALNQQKTKITWQPLLENLENAVATVQASPTRDARSAIKLAFTMSAPDVNEVMVYLARLKESLK
jgi:hypothetical protein